MTDSQGKQTSDMLLKAYIKTMAQSSLTDRDETNPMEIDLVMSGGAFNGAYGFGVILYLLELVEQKKMIIKKVSGCSIGAMAALCVLCKKATSTFCHNWELLKQDIRDNQRMNNVKKLIKEYVDECLKDNDLSFLKDKLYITMTNLKIGQHIVRSEWSSKEELQDDLIASCFIPYIVDGNSRYKDEYIDGIQPHIFKDTTRRCMYVDLHSMHKNRWLKCICTSQEKNPNQRVLEGVNECCGFLNGEDSYLCSWTDNWKIWTYGIIRLQFIIIYTIAVVIELLNKINVPDVISENVLYRGITSTLLKLVQDSFYLVQY